jgi:hypothetical protein
MGEPEPSEGGTVGLAGALRPPPAPARPLCANAAGATVKATVIASTDIDPIAFTDVRMTTPLLYDPYPAMLRQRIRVHITTIVHKPSWLHPLTVTLLRQIGWSHRNLATAARHLGGIIQDAMEIAISIIARRTVRHF